MKQGYATSAQTFRDFRDTIIFTAGLRVLLLADRMNLGDVSSREPHDSSISFLSLVRRNDDLHACGVGLGKGVRQVRHFISSHFSAVGVRKVPVCDEHGELAKLRFNPHSAIGVSRSSDFYARSMRVVRGDSAARERKKTANELVGFISGDIDAIFGNRLE